MEITMTPITNSSNLAGYHYDAASERLTIEFKSGNRYRYDNVPDGLATKMAEADSPGKFFTEHIRNAKGFGGTRLLSAEERAAAIADGVDPAEIADK